MQSYQADSAALPQRTGYQGIGYSGISYRLALAAFADDVVGTLAHLFAYVGTLALLAMLGLAALEQLPGLGDESAPAPAWNAISACPPEFTANRANSFSKSGSYTVDRRTDDDSAAGTESKRRACKPAAPPDWLADAKQPQLRGSL